MLGLLAHRFIKLRGHEIVGFARLSDYAVERLGLSRRQLEESARVANLLNGLPQSVAAFLEGRIGWAKVRLLVSLSTPEDEAQWLEVASNVDVRTLSSLTRNARSAAREERSIAGFGTSTDATRNRHDGHVQGEQGEQGEQDEEDEEERVLLRIECNRKTKLMWNEVRRLASRMAGRVLTPWQVAERVAAEASTTPGPYAAVWEEEPWKSLSAIHSKKRDRPISSRSGLFSSRAEGQALFATGDAAELSFAHELDDLSEKNALELDAAMRRVQLGMQQSDCRLGRALGLFVDLRLYEEFGYRSAAAYALERLGMSERSARELVSVTAAAGKRSAELADAYARGRLTWLQVRTLLSVLRPGNASVASAGSAASAASVESAASAAPEASIASAASQWIARAEEVTLRRLSDEVEWALRRADQFPGAAAMLPPQRDADLRLDSTPDPSPPSRDRQMCADGDADTDMSAPEPDRQMCADGSERFNMLGRIHVSFMAPASVATLFRSVLQGFAAPQEDRHLAFERMLEPVLAHWKAQPRHRDPVFARDGFRCTAPGCSSLENLHDHHIVPRSAGGSNEMHNRTTLCAWHHLRAVHGGLARTSGSAPDALDWELGIQGRDTPLLRLRGDRYMERR
ncbi:MAG: HNH endonuclease signature motif containing protein [Candidatus Binatia bacterium]